MHQLLLSTPAALAAGEGAHLGAFGEGNRTGFLLIALMLAFLLLSRVHRRGTDASVRPPPPRRNPITYEELARTVYQLAVSCDLEGYRGLFLAGGEAATVFGAEVADSYLSARTVEVLEESLVTIGAHLADNPRFHGVRLDTDDHLFLQVRRANDDLVEIELGTVVRVGAVVRLVEAPYQIA
jgi:hypothetical protein